jgi:GNAT superfamily N-acetyltransferase
MRPLTPRPSTPPDLTVHVATPDELTEEHWRQLAGDSSDPFDIERLGSGEVLQWRVKDEYVVLMRGSAMVARAGVVVVPAVVEEATAAVAELREFEVVGFGGVLVAAGERGGGLGRAVMAEATDLATTLGPGIGMLFCFPDRAPFYAALGWHDVGAPVAVEQPEGIHLMSQRAMWRPLRSGATLPAGAIRLQSQPF